MEALYIKLYEKYSKLKAAKDADLEKINQEQESKFLEFVSAAETLIEHLTSENKALCQNIDEFQREVHSLRVSKEQQFEDFQQRLIEEKQKNQQLSEEIEQLRKLQHEELNSGVRNDQREHLQMNSVQRSPHSSKAQYSETPRRMTRKRARLSVTNDIVVHSPSAVSHVELSNVRRSLVDSPFRDVSDAHVSQPECCRSDIHGGGPGKCLFQGLVECLIGMNVSIAHKSGERSIRAVHQSSGYSFSLKWLDKGTKDGGELLYSVSSLGTFVKVAPEWMKEVIIFSMNMCPIFFDRISRVIKQC